MQRDVTASPFGTPFGLLVVAGKFMQRFPWLRFFRLRSILDADGGLVSRQRRSLELSG